MSKRKTTKRFLAVSRTLNRKGGSYQVTIPPIIVESLGLKEGRQVIFLLDKEKKYALVKSGTTFRPKIEHLGETVEIDIFHTFLTKEDVEKLLEVLKRKS